MQAHVITSQRWLVAIDLWETFSGFVDPGNSLMRILSDILMRSAGEIVAIRSI